MRGLFALLIAIAIVGLVGAAAYTLREPLAGAGLRWAMARAGVENPQGNVEGISLNEIAISGLSAGPKGAPGVYVGKALITYDLREVWRARRVREVTLDLARLRLAVDEQGRVSIPGVRLPERQAESGETRLPFGKLTLTNAVVEAATPFGDVSGPVALTFDADSGGSASFDLASAALDRDAYAMRDARLAGAAAFADDGAVSANIAITGALSSPQIAFSNADIAFEGGGASWRDALAGDIRALDLAGVVQIRALEIPIEQTPALARLGAPVLEPILGERAYSLEMEGETEIRFGDGVFGARPPAGRSLRARSNTGVALVVGANGDLDWLTIADDSLAASARLAVTGAATDAEGAFTVTREGDEAWTFFAGGQAKALTTTQYAIGDSRFMTTGRYRDGRLEGLLQTETHIKRGAVGRLNIFDAPVEARAVIAADMNAQRLTVDVEDCLKFPRGRFSISGQDTEASLAAAKLCPHAGAPLAAFDWSGAPVLTAVGALEASSVRYRLGQTRINGAPPSLTFSAAYRPDEQRTEISGAVRGGAMTLNDTLDGDGAAGRYQYSLDAEEMRLRLTLDRARVAQHMDLPLVAPVMIDGVVDLVGDRVTMNYRARTPAGVRLGAGDGVHNVSTGIGRTEFRLDALTFAPPDLQPDVLAPVLKGVIGRTTGGATGAFRFDWRPDEINSSGRVALDGITFGGPTRVVTQTRGVAGEIRFSSLWPVVTDGVQNLAVAAVDLDALQLETGEIAFELPGDETLRIERAAFPWFGGRIGVYDASASIAGGEAVAPLKAEAVDLRQLFEYADIDGLTGEGILSGSLPLVVEDGRARIEGGFLRSDGPGVISYRGEAAQQAAAAGEDAQIAFDILRNLEYETLEVTVDGALDGRLNFNMLFVGRGDVAVNRQRVNVPVRYRITLDAALLELLQQANLSRDIELQIQRGLEQRP